MQSSQPGTLQTPRVLCFPIRQFIHLSLQYPDFALGILLFGNFVFALSCWPVFGTGELPRSAEISLPAQPGRVSTSTAITGPGCGGTSWWPRVGVVLCVDFSLPGLRGKKDVLRFNFI